ncbi:MAG: TonB-dependent receptor [Terriglobia bacterium]
MDCSCRLKTLLATIFAFFCMPLGLLAQVELGSISGEVRDPTGASVVGAEVTTQSVATSIEFKTVSNDTGNFLAPNLIPGSYTVVVTKSGFKTINRTDIVVRANQRTTVNLVLEVGEVTQTVEVTGELAPLLQKETATVSAVLESRQVTELPTLDRTMFNLAGLMPGVTIANTQANSINIPDNARVSMGISANGLGASAINNFTLDGVNNTQVSATSSYQGVLPPIEAIQEFTIDASNALPELGRGGTNVRVTLKSGGNQLHGSAYEFMRNDALNARNFFDRPDPITGQQKPDFNSNNFGGTIGGPIIKNKMFFFGDYAGLRLTEGRTWVSQVADDALRNGDFSGTSQIIYDPATYDPATNTRQPFPGNKIPANRINPVSANILNYMPKGNAGISALGVQALQSTSLLNRTQDSMDAKLDYVFGQKDSVGGRFSWGRSHAFIPGAWSDLPGLAPAAQGGAVQQAGASQYLPGTVSNPSANLGLQWIRNISPTTINEARFSWLRAGANAQVLGHGTNYGDILGIPNANNSDVNSGFPTQNIAGYSQMGEAGAYPLITIENSFQLLDNFTLVRGSHTFKMGADIRMLRQTFIQLLGSNVAGSFSYSQDMTGNPQSPNATGNSFASFLLGIPSSGAIKNVSGTESMRWWEYSGYFQDVWKMTPKLTLTYGLRYEYFKPEVAAHDRISNFDFVTGLLVLPNGGGSQPALSTRALVGTNCCSFQPRLGVAYQLTPKTVLRSGFAWVSGMGMSKAFGFMDGNAPFAGGYNFFNTATPQQINRYVSDGFPPTVAFNPITAPGPLIWAADPKGPNPYILQWSMGIQHELASNLVVEVNYVGNSAMHLMNNNGPTNFDAARPGTGPAPLRTPYYNTLPNGPTILYWQWRDHSSYESLQASITKRFTNGLSFQAAYTWSHILGTWNSPYYSSSTNYLTSSTQDQAIANMSINAPQRFVANWSYELPYGKGKKWGNDASPVVNGIIGGWSFQGIVGLQSGSPYTVTGGAGVPNRICDGQTPPGGHTVQKWFDTSCFVLPAAIPDPVRGGLFTPMGNSGYNILRGDGIRQNDLSLSKNWNIKSESRYFQFRVDFLNAFNNPQFLLPLSNIQAGTAGLVTVAGPARNIQLGFKYVF